jgi:drug/metabolite transporter (DMT)-like permease
MAGPAKVRAMPGDVNRAVTLRELVLANLGLTLMIGFWGAFFPILERLLLSWDVYSITLARQVVGTAVLYVAVLVERRRTPLPRVRAWWPILLLGGVGVTLGSLLTSLGVQYSSGLSSAIISTTNPVGSALTAAALYREPLARGLLFGTALSVIGGLIAVLGGQSMEGAHFHGGEIMIVLANVLWTWMSMAAQRWMRGYSQMQITCYTVATGAFWLLLLFPLVATSKIVPIQMDFSPLSLAMVAFAGAFPIAIGNFFWHYGVSRIGVVVSSMYNNLLPVAAVAVTVLMGGGFTLWQLLGAGVILVGVFTAQLLALRRSSRAQS